MSNAQLHFACESLNNCHIYFGTWHEAELINCLHCEPCAIGGCLSNNQSEPLVYSFVALSPYVHITLTQPPSPKNAANFTAGIFPEDFSECIEFVYACDESVGEVYLETDELTQGKIYNLYLDGCASDPDSEGDIEFEFGESEFETEAVFENIEFGIVEECGIPYSPEFNYCRGTEVFFKPFFNENVSTDFLNGKSFVFNAITEDAEFEFEIEFPFERAIILLEEPGLYTFCLESIGVEECSSLFYPEEICFDEVITISDNNILYTEDYSICQFNLEVGFLPSPPWSGGYVSEPGTYFNRILNNCECEYLQQINIQQLDASEGEIIVELCPQDLPHELFGGELIIQVGDLYESDLIIIEEASTQVGYQQEYCDSIIELTIIYLDDQDICNKCDLAYSVNLSNLVTCLPFDNSDLDLSNQDNHASLNNGTDFTMDRFEEDDFALSFDGENDFVSIDHSVQFIHQQYSMSFWFKKDEDTFTDQNPKEALVFKGLEGSSNKTFSITLERHFTDKMLLDFTINSGPYEKSIRYGSFEYNRWYHIAVVNNRGNMKLVIDGAVAESNFSNINSRSNGEDLLIGVIPSTTGYRGYYKGQLDEFRFWTRIISDREAYLLYRPEAEFHLTEKFQLSCCETVDFHGTIYNSWTFADTVRVEGVSPTGEDSLYIINISQSDLDPYIDLSAIPGSIFVELNASCNELCQATIEWDDPPHEAFQDECDNYIIEQSHYSPLIIEGGDQIIEVVYSITDECGYRTEASFLIDIQCASDNIPEIPEPQQLILLADTLCQSSMNTVCLGTQLNWDILHINEINQGVVAYSDDIVAEWVYELRSPSGIDTLVFENQIAPIISIDAELKGEYQLCLKSISNVCFEQQKEVCATVRAENPEDLYHGLISLCKNDFEVLSEIYPDISAELIDLIGNEPVDQMFSIEQLDACLCPYVESVELKLVNDFEPEEIELILCDTELPYDFYGITIDENRLFDEEEIVLAGQSHLLNFEGENCDSTVIFTTTIRESSITALEYSICPGEDYNGISEAGDYQFEFINQTGCDSIVLLSLEILPPDHPECQSTDTNELNSEVVTLYPNPARDKIYFTLPDNISSDVKYEIISIDGGKLVSGKADSTLNRIDIHNLPSGVYFIRFSHQDFHFVDSILIF